MSNEDEQVPVRPPVDELVAVLLERLEDVLAERDVVGEEVLDQDVHRDLAGAPPLLEARILELEKVRRVRGHRRDEDELVVHVGHSADERHVQHAGIDRDEDVRDDEGGDAEEEGEDDEAEEKEALLREEAIKQK